MSARIPESIGVPVEGTVMGGAADGASAQGMMLNAPPAAVLIVTHTGQVMIQSPMGYDLPTTQAILARALTELAI